MKSICSPPTAVCRWMLSARINCGDPSSRQVGTQDDRRLQLRKPGLASHPPLDPFRSSAASQAAEELVWPVIPRSPPFLLADDEESRIVLKTLRARFLAPLGMTAWKGFSAACSAGLRRRVGLQVGAALLDAAPARKIVPSGTKSPQVGPPRDGQRAMHFPGLCPQKLAGAKRPEVASRHAGPLLRVELARADIVALTFRSARWGGGQEDADLKVGATKAPQSGPPRRAAALQRPPEQPGGKQKRILQK